MIYAISSCYFLPHFLLRLLPPSHLVFSSMHCIYSLQFCSITLVLDTAKWYGYLRDHVTLYLLLQHLPSAGTLVLTVPTFNGLKRLLEGLGGMSRTPEFTTLFDWQSQSLLTFRAQCNRIVYLFPLAFASGCLCGGGRWGMTTYFAGVHLELALVNLNTLHADQSDVWLMHLINRWMHLINRWIHLLFNFPGWP